GEGILPEKPFAGTCGERCVDDLAIFSVRTVEADVHVGAAIPLVLAVVVEGELIWPAIVSLPGRVRALENEVSSAVIANDEDYIALQSLAFRGEFAEIDAAGPIVWNRDVSA